MYPILFQQGPFTVKTAGVFLVLGLVVSLVVFLKIIRRRQIDINFLTDNILWLILIGILGGRLGEVIINFSNYTWFSLFYLWDGNLNFYSGLIFFIGLLIFLCRKNQKNIWRYLDVLLYPFLITMFFVSSGDFFSGINYGVPHDFDFLPSVTYNSPEVRFFVPIHPVQVYSAFLILLYLLGAWFLQRKRRTEGMIALIIFLIYAGGEFIIEFIRGDPVRLIFDYRINQLFDLLFIVIVIIFIIVRSHKKYLKINKIK